VEGFRNHSLPKEKWTHEAHITTAIWFIMHRDSFDALCRIKSGIISYNLSTGSENNGTNGYHETITIFWWKLLTLFIEKQGSLAYDQMCNSFLESIYNRKDIVFDFYSKELLMSGMARAMYVAPDIKQILLED
jgi:hypothetical protein